VFIDKVGFSLHTQLDNNEILPAVTVHSANGELIPPPPSHSVLPCSLSTWFR
jgi:hypothetical protein